MKPLSLTATLLVLTGLLFAAMSCDDTGKSDTDGDDTPIYDGDQPDGDTGDGDQTDGDRPDGDRPDGDLPDGDSPDGDTPTDGDTPPDGDDPVDGDDPQPDGDQPDGDEPDGDLPDGDDDSWPPSTPWWGVESCNLPACDNTEEIDFDPSGTWVQTMTTTSTDCNPAMAAFNKMVNIGNVETGDPGPLHIEGGCAYRSDAKDAVTGVAHGATMIVCDVIRDPNAMGVVVVQTGTLTFTDGAATGTATAYLTNVPFYGACHINLNMVMQRQED